MMAKRSNDGLPPRGDYYVATAQALQENGGIANIEEIEDRVAEILGLTPEARSLPHGDGRRTQFQYDLAWVRTYLKWAGAVDNPERGVWQLTPLGAAMSDEELQKLWGDVIARQRAERRSLPEVPKQGAGPHFTIEQGVLAFARSVDGRGNDLRRLRALQPIVQETADALLVALSKHEGLWPGLEKAVRDYIALLNGDLRSIDFGRLFGLGVILNNSVQAAKKNIDGKNIYALPPECGVLADSLLEMHGPFVLGSKDGQALLADSERFSADAERRAFARESELNLGRAIASSTAPAAPQVKKHISELLDGEESSPRKDHQSAYRGGLVTNAAIVFAGAAALSVVAAGTMAGGALPAAFFGLAMAVFGNRALQNSKAGRELTEQLSSLVDKATVDFVNDNEALFREFARQHRLRWLDRALDWSLSQSSEASREFSTDPDSLQVLLIEPDPVESERLKMLLKTWGYRCDFAARTQRSAVASASSSPPDLILAEIQLADGSSGIDAIVEIFHARRCPVVFVTAYPERLLRHNRPDPVHLVTKPFDPATLRQVIEEALVE